MADDKSDSVLVGVDHITQVNGRTFWDIEARNEFRLVTQDDIDKIDWNNVTPEQILNALPAGTSFEVAMHVLIRQICQLTKRLNDLENEFADKVILDPAYDTKPNR